MANTDSKVPTSIVERIIDAADKATAKELSNLESVVAKLVINLNTPPRIEDINRLVEDIKVLIENEVKNRLGTIDSDITTLTKECNGLTNKMTTFLSKAKWIAGIVIVAVSISSSVISYVTKITEKSVNANTTVKIKQIEEKHEKEVQQRNKEFEKILKEIKKLKVNPQK